MIAFKVNLAKGLRAHREIMVINTI